MTDTSVSADPRDELLAQARALVEARKQRSALVEELMERVTNLIAENDADTAATESLLDEIERIDAARANAIH